MWPLLSTPPAHVDLEPAVPAACAPCRAPPTPRCSCLPSWLISGRVGQLQTVRRARSGCELPLTAWVCPVLPHQGLLGGQVPPLGPAGTIQRRWGTGCWTELAFLPCQVPV